MHDINLPLVNTNFPVWGVKYLFDGINAPKDQSNANPPNIGCFQIENKEELKKQILNILNTKEYETQPSEDYEAYVKTLQTT